MRGMFFISIGAAAAFSIIHIMLMKQPRSIANILEIVLCYFFGLVVALSALIAFLGHTFRADEVAAQIGWPTGNPFQSEVAVANLAFAVVGLLSVWFRGDFWLATAISYAVFMVGAGAIHVRELMVAGNIAPLNSGLTILGVDFVLPVVVLVAVIIHRRVAASTPHR